MDYIVTDPSDLSDLLGDDNPPKPERSESATTAPPECARASGDKAAPKQPERALANLPKRLHERDLAVLLGITRQAIGDHVRNGILDRSGRAEYELAPTVKAYCEHLRSHARQAGRPSAGTDAYKAARTAKLEAETRLAEIKVAQANGDLVDSVAVTREWQSVLRDVRAAMLAVPSRFGGAMPHLSPNDIAALDREIRAALEGLADGND